MIEEGKYLKVADKLREINNKLDGSIMSSLTPEERERQTRNLADCARLVEWMTLNGAVLNKVKVHYFGRHYRGILADRDTEVRIDDEVNESLLFVPRKLLITYEDSHQSSLVKQLENDLLKQMKSTSHTPLAIFLLEEHEKGENSFYFPYLATFPEKVEGLPIEFSEEELELLECSPIKETIIKRKQNIIHDYELLKKELQGFDRFSFNEFKHFRNLIGSRVFGLEIEGRKTGAMVPFAGKLA